MLALVNASGHDLALELREVDEPAAAPSETIVDVRAVALNRGELRLLASRPDGWRPGQDVAGVVAVTAGDGSGPSAGARVVAWAEQAGWAQRVAVPASRVVELPETVDFAHAATLPVAGMTALRLLRLGGHLLGGRVLVTGAAGGVGRFAVELAVRAGAEVTAVASTPERAAGLRELGAADVVHDIADARAGFDLILESAGGSSLSTAVGLLAPDGVCAVFGNSSGEPSTLGFADFAGAPRARLVPFRVYESGDLPTVSEDLARLVGFVADGRLHPEVGFQGDWREPQVALAALRDRRVRGKAVLEVHQP